MSPPVRISEFARYGGEGKLAEEGGFFSERAGRGLRKTLRSLSVPVDHIDFLPLSLAEGIGVPSAGLSKRFACTIEGGQVCPDLPTRRCLLLIQ